MNEYKKEQTTPGDGGEAWSADVDALTFWARRAGLSPPARACLRGESACDGDGERAQGRQLLCYARPSDGRPGASKAMDSGH